MQWRDLWRLRQYLTQEAVVKATNVLVSNRLDYCNSFFRSLSGFNVSKLQSVQNSLLGCTTGVDPITNSTTQLQKSGIEEPNP